MHLPADEEETPFVILIAALLPFEKFFRQPLQSGIEMEQELVPLIQYTRNR